MICRWCGSILNDGAHTDELRTMWRMGDKVIRPNLYRVWGNIRERCNNPKQSRYKDYGGRGITICVEWDSYAVFRRWVLNNGWRPGLQIDRRDNGKGYYPENCRIVNRHQQQQNRRLPSRHKTGKRYACLELTENDVYFIRESGKTNAELARELDVHNGTISRIRKRIQWAHLPERAPERHDPEELK